MVFSDGFADASSTSPRDRGRLGAGLRLHPDDPGDAVAIMLGANAEVTPERIAAVRTRLGLDLPIHEQYVAWLSDVRGDFGVSI
ncbi:MAG: hypothetical protein HPM95_09115 [Alphaproteobacteria bacterium]|nr:hypothetical protein [Alphaproteobacteria bacterium]